MPSQTMDGSIWTSKKEHEYPIQPQHYPNPAVVPNYSQEIQLTEEEDTSDPLLAT